MLGMAIAHFGIGMFAIGVSGVESYKVEKDVALRPGDRASQSPATNSASSTQAMSADRTTMRSRRWSKSPAGGQPVASLLKPQKRHFWVQQTDNSQAAIAVNWSRDLFVAMGNSLGDGAWSMRIQYKPLVRYIWLGALVMADRRLGRGDRPALPLKRGRPRRGSGVAAAAAAAEARVSPDVEIPAADRRVRRPRGAVRVRARIRARDIRALPSPLIGKPAPAFTLERRARSGAHGQQRGSEGPGLRLQCLGHLVRRLPPGTRDPARDRPAKGRAHHRTRLEGSSASKAPKWLTQLGNPYQAWPSTMRDAPPSTGACTARPKPSWSTPGAGDLQAHRADDARGLAAGIPAADRRGAPGRRMSAAAATRAGGRRSRSAHGWRGAAAAAGARRQWSAGGPGAAGALRTHHQGPALPGLSERIGRRFERRARRGSAPPGARDAAGRHRATMQSSIS